MENVIQFLRIENVVDTGKVSHIVFKNIKEVNNNLLYLYIYLIYCDNYP